MSSHRDVFHYSDPNFHYESGSGPPIARRSRSPGPPWVPSVIAPDQSGHGHVHQSLDQVGDLLEAYEVQESSYNLETPAIYPLPVEDMSYPHIDQHPSYPPQATPFQDPGSSTNVAYSDNSGFELANLPFYEYPDFYYGPSQLQDSYTHCDPTHEFSGLSLIGGEHTINETHSFSLSHREDIQTSQVPPASVYPRSSSTQLASLNIGGPVYGPDTRPTRPDQESLSLDRVNTGSMAPPNIEAHSHPSPVATSSNQSAADSPSRKRLFQLTADEELPVSAVYNTSPTVQLTQEQAVRRVAPRTDRAWSVHSTSSDSHRRSRSTDIPGRGPLIPQDRYTTSSVSAFSTPEQYSRITFDLENPNQVGIPVTDILNRSGTFHRMLDRTHAFDHMGKKTFTLRVQWPGYKPWSKTVSALNWKKDRAPITREKLAEAVAVGIRGMLQKMRNDSCDPDSLEWNVGPNGIQLDQLGLVALVHVSRGSWQPQLCLLQPRQH